MSGNSLATISIGSTEAKGCAEDQIKAFPRKRAEYLFGVSAFWNVFNIGDIDIFDFIFDIHQAFVMGLRPTAIIVRADQHHGDIELTLLDFGDFEIADFLNFFFAG